MARTRRLLGTRRLLSTERRGLVQLPLLLRLALTLTSCAQIMRDDKGGSGWG